MWHTFGSYLLTDPTVHAVVKGVFLGVIATIASDLDSFIAWRQTHPGLAYDWGILIARCVKVACITGPASIGVHVVAPAVGHAVSSLVTP